MSYAVTHMMKMKSHDLKGMQFHNQRERESRTNPDIDLAKTYQNYDLINEQLIQYNERVKEIIGSQKIGTRKTRKDAVLVNEFVVTSDRAFFEGLTPEDERRFFEESLQFFGKRYDIQNVAYAVVHKDEYTPHMHLGIVPMKDGRLQGKNVFNRQELLWLQEEYPKHMQSLGFDLARGERGSERGHLTTAVFKLEKTKEQLVQVEKQLLEKRDVLIEMVPVEEQPIPFLKKELQVETVKKGFLQKETFERETGNYILTPSQYEELSETVMAAVVIKKDYERLKHTALAQENQELLRQNELFFQKWEQATKENKSLRVENEELKIENSNLKAITSILRDEINVLYKTIKEFLKERTEGAKAFKMIFNELAEKIKEKFANSHQRKDREPQMSQFEQLHRNEMVRERNRGLER